MSSLARDGRGLLGFGAALIAIGLLGVFLEDAGKGELFIDAFFVLSATGAFFILLGAIVLCTNNPPRKIMSFAGRALGLIILVFVSLAVLTPNASVHGPIMPVIIALVGLGATALVILVVGWVKLTLEQRVPPAA